MKKRGPGRPHKYARFLRCLEDDQIYTPAAIVRYGKSCGLFPEGISSDQERHLGLKIRHTLARLSKNHSFPAEGDGWVAIPGQAPMRGWQGWRWKAALPD
jgi:hypothetical protein